MGRWVAFWACSTAHCRAGLCSLLVGADGSRSTVIPRKTGTRDAGSGGQPRHRGLLRSDAWFHSSALIRSKSRAYGLRSASWLRISLAARPLPSRRHPPHQPRAARIPIPPCWGVCAGRSLRCGGGRGTIRSSHGGLLPFVAYAGSVWRGCPTAGVTTVLMSRPGPVPPFFSCGECPGSNATGDQQVGPVNHFPGPPEHVVLKGAPEVVRAQRGGAGVSERSFLGLPQGPSPARPGPGKVVERSSAPCHRRGTHP